MASTRLLLLNGFSFRQLFIAHHAHSPNKDRWELLQELKKDLKEIRYMKGPLATSQQALDQVEEACTFHQQYRHYKLVMHTKQLCQWEGTTSSNGAKWVVNFVRMFCSRYSENTAYMKFYHSPNINGLEERLEDTLLTVKKIVASDKENMAPLPQLVASEEHRYQNGLWPSFRAIVGCHGKGRSA
ncbi:hypothetical protein O0I10_011023 [Lichtheimia ornata]|uniref:Uncharacterized protein n=1 Tax=Lichtheimia ornata TaxID=688661 RepID=A0AAD7UVD9_9FUNG|nr:uncharacterized protein O0I10_011023 [Lichtheimia ornata]KAJ8653372.1 hypothetical protein O0I10_011023 [Lichtheimia ornata]